MKFDVSLLPARTQYTRWEAWADAVSRALQTFGELDIDTESFTFKRPEIGSVRRSLYEKLLEIAATPYDSGAVGDGVADDTAALTTMFANNSVVALPAYGIFHVTDTIQVPLDNTIIIGMGGEITSGVELLSKPLLRVTGDFCHFDKLRMQSTARTSPQTNGASVAVYVEGNAFTITNSIIDYYQNGVMIEATGEWYDFAIIGNRFINCVGAGDGPDDAVSAFGENRGDAVAAFGARGIIANNFAQAASGEDCRTGFFSENLGSFAADTSGDDNARGVIIHNNICVPSEDGTGRFRRGISCEGVADNIVMGNFVRGASWMEIQLVNTTHRTLCSGNRIVCDLPSDYLAGAAWGPARCGIINYTNPAPSSTEHLSIVDNLILVQSTIKRGIVLQGLTGEATELMIARNRIIAEQDMGNLSAIDCTDSPVRIHLLQNKIYGLWQRGIITISVSDIECRGNLVEGSWDFAIRLQDAEGVTNAVGNQVYNCEDGIELIGTINADVAHNDFKNVGLEISVADTVAAVIVHDNFCHDGDGDIGRFAGAEDNTVLLRNLGFSVDHRVINTAFADIDHFINTWGKHAGLKLIDDNDVEWQALGPNPGDDWYDGASITITPA